MTDAAEPQTRETAPSEPTKAPAEVTARQVTLDYIVYELRKTGASAVGTDTAGKNALYLTVQETVADKKLIAIGENAFEGCRNLKNIHLPDTLESIGDYAFSGCAKLPKIKLPASLTSIGDHAFEGCTGMTEITIPAGVTRLYAETFAGSGIRKIHLPKGCRIPEGKDPFGLGAKCVIDYYEP